MLKRIADQLQRGITNFKPQAWWPDAHQEMRRIWERTQTGDSMPVIFDVGAYRGETAKHFRKCFPEFKVYAFEPFQASFRTLERNTAADPAIKCFNLGLTNRDACLDFHANSSAATNSLLPAAKGSVDTWGQGAPSTTAVVSAQFRTLDSVMQELGIPAITILKLDVQGAEHLVLDGARSACGKGKIGMIYSEIITQPTYAGQKRFDEMLALFYAAGFELHNFFNFNLKKNGMLRQVDAIFTRRKVS